MMMMGKNMQLYKKKYAICNKISAAVFPLCPMTGKRSSLQCQPSPSDKMWANVVINFFGGEHEGRGTVKHDMK